MTRAYKRNERPGPIPFSAMTFNGVGGPAGNDLPEPITGCTCDYCGKQMTSGLASKGLHICNRKACRLRHARLTGGAA